MKKAIIIGGTSGIGRALAEKLVANQWNVGITGRRLALLEEIKAQAPSQIAILEHDVTEIASTDELLASLFDQFESVDLVVVASGFAAINHQLDWALEHKVIDTNVVGISKVYEFAFTRFKAQGYGHLVGITSIAALRGNRFCPSYSAAKAFQANYLEALRGISKKGKLNIKVTDIQPGFVDTAMAQGPGLFWVAPVPKAANQIYKGILKGKRKVYITKRWRLIAWIMRHAPNWMMERAL